MLAKNYRFVGMTEPLPEEPGCNNPASLDSSRNPAPDLEPFFQLSLDLLCIIGWDGYFQQLNSIWSKVLSYSDAELKAASWLHWVHPDDQAIVRIELQQLSVKRSPAPPSHFLGSASFKARFRCRDGSYRWFHWHLSATADYLYGVVRDVTDRKAARDALQFSEDRFRSLTNSIHGSAIYLMDVQGHIINWSPGAEKIHGYTESQVLGQFVSMLYPEAQAKQRQPEQDLQQAIQLGRLEQEQSWRRPDGSQFTAHTITTVLTDRAGRLQGFVRIVQDNQHLTLLNQQQTVLSSCDPLTRLPNRLLLTERLNSVYEVTKHYDDYLFAVIFLDIDRFKLINDSLGHLVGDQLLIQIAKRLRLCLRAGDMVARLGGDEFAILLEDIASLNNAIEIAQRIQDSITVPFILEGHEVFTSASIGIAMNLIPHDRAEDFLVDADTAMYRAKAKGRGRYEVFDMEMQSQIVERMALENDLRGAIDRNQFQLVYQPVVSLRKQAVIGLEALLRWQHPERGLLNPGEFLPIAEEIGLIGKIDAWVLQQSTSQLRQWLAHPDIQVPLWISVNFSGRHFTQPENIDPVWHTLDNLSIDPHFLRLEITESILLAETEQVAGKLNQLRQRGVEISLDDFGTGYSSLSYLHRYPIDTLKIDHSFIDRIDQAGEKLELVRSIISLAWNLGMNVIAEGVETSTQMSQLRSLQCEAAQGQLICVPLTPEQITAWLLNNQTQIELPSS